MACASASPCVLARARAVAPRNAASRGTEPSSSGARGASPRSLGDRRAPWARAASGGVDVSLSSTLPALKPWAEAKVQKSSAGEEEGRRAALEAELEAARDENAKLAAELDIKEEECNMLASMVSSTRGASLKTRSASATATTVSGGVSPLKAAL